MTKAAFQQKLLVWSDAATVATGFGKITKKVVSCLIDAFHFEVDQIGINFLGDFYDRSTVPWRIHPANARDSRDPFGKSLLLQSIQNGDYDFIWMQVDTQHYFSILPNLRELKLQYERVGKEFPRVIYYVPIDSELIRTEHTDFDVCDLIVPYSSFGRQQIVKSWPEYQDKTTVIECGYDSSSSVILSNESTKIFRSSYFDIKDDNTFLVLNVNRNSQRKMLPFVMQVFAKFHQLIPKSKLYLHTDPRDKASGINLLVVAAELGLEVGKQVQFPEEFSVSRPKSEATLTAIYNASNCFFTASYGEGWGLTHTDAMAMEVPVVAPDNSVFPEQLAGGSRGYLYPCHERFWFQGTGLRPVARLEDALQSLQEVYTSFSAKSYSEPYLNQRKKVEAARAWIGDRKWELICKQWVEVISKHFGLS